MKKTFKINVVIAVAFLAMIGMVHGQDVQPNRPTITQFFIPKLGDTVDQVKSKIVESPRPSGNCIPILEQDKVLNEAFYSTDKKTRKQAQTAYQEFKATNGTMLNVCQREKAEISSYTPVTTGTSQAGEIALRGIGWNMTIDFKEGVVTKASGIYTFGSARAGNPNFDEFVASASKQYGDATQTVKAAQNAYGAKFDLRSATWHLQKGGLLTLDETLDFNSNVGFSRPLFIYLSDKDGVDTDRKPAIDPFK